MSLLTKKISLSGSIFVITSLLLISLVIFFIKVVYFSPEAIANRQGVPETGWGALIIGVPTLIAIFILTIIDLAAGVIYIINRKRSSN